MIDASSPCQDCPFPSSHIYPRFSSTSRGFVHRRPFELNVYCSRAPVFVLLVIHRGARSRGRAPGASRRAVKTRLVLSTKFTNATRPTAHRSPRQLLSSRTSTLPSFLFFSHFFFFLSFLFASTVENKKKPPHPSNILSSPSFLSHSSFDIRIGIIVRSFFFFTFFHIFSIQGLL